MRFILFVYADQADQRGGPDLEIVKAMNAYNEELSKAGALLALDGLLPAATRLTFGEGARPAVTDGPFTETKELVGGYWIIQARSKEEAIEWASRAPLPAGTIEVRQIGEAEDYSDAIAEAREISATPPEQTVAE